MSFEKKQAILNKIKEYDRIMIFRHFRPDGDCVGASKGLKAILQLSFPEKEILLVDDQHSDYLDFLGRDTEAVEDSVYETALGIVVDTANTDRISNKKFALCKELVKIDHHIEISPYGTCSWVEEEASSCCEMITQFYATFQDQLKIDTEAATYLYTGMVTDSGRFRFRSVSGDTMRYAGLLLDQGIDTDTLYANLYLDDFNFLKFKAHVYQQMQITENGVAYIFVDKAMQEQFGLTSESASNVVSFMDSIRGCLCWLAFIENPNEIRVRLRSRFVTINGLAEEYSGGGHACAAGATIHSLEEMQEMLRKADAHIKEYKESHEGWL